MCDSLALAQAWPFQCICVSKAVIVAGWGPLTMVQDSSGRGGSEEHRIYRKGHANVQEGNTSYRCVKDHVHIIGLGVQSPTHSPGLDGA